MVEKGFKAIKVKLSDYEIKTTLGTGYYLKILNSSGSFGRVRLARNKATNEFIALKMLKKAEILRLK